jgi:hypothetical protein
MPHQQHYLRFPALAAYVQRILNERIELDMLLECSNDPNCVLGHTRRRRHSRPHEGARSPPRPRTSKSGRSGSRQSNAQRYLRLRASVEKRSDNNAARSKDSLQETHIDLSAVDEGIQLSLAANANDSATQLPAVAEHPHTGNATQRYSVTSRHAVRRPSPRCNARRLSRMSARSRSSSSSPSHSNTSVHRLQNDFVQYDNHKKQDASSSSLALDVDSAVDLRSECSDSASICKVPQSPVVEPRRRIISGSNERLQQASCGRPSSVFLRDDCPWESILPSAGAHIARACSPPVLAIVEPADLQDKAQNPLKVSAPRDDTVINHVTPTPTTHGTQVTSRSIWTQATKLARSRSMKARIAQHDAAKHATAAAEAHTSNQQSLSSAESMQKTQPARSEESKQSEQAVTHKKSGLLRRMGQRALALVTSNSRSATTDVTSGGSSEQSKMDQPKHLHFGLRSNSMPVSKPGDPASLVTATVKKPLADPQPPASRLVQPSIRLQQQPACRTPVTPSTCSNLSAPSQPTENDAVRDAAKTQVTTVAPNSAGVTRNRLGRHMRHASIPAIFHVKSSTDSPEPVSSPPQSPMQAINAPSSIPVNTKQVQPLLRPSKVGVAKVKSEVAYEHEVAAPRPIRPTALKPEMLKEEPPQEDTVYRISTLMETAMERLVTDYTNEAEREQAAVRLLSQLAESTISKKWAGLRDSFSLYNKKSARNIRRPTNPYAR